MLYAGAWDRDTWRRYRSNDGLFTDGKHGIGTDAKGTGTHLVGMRIALGKFFAIVANLVSEKRPTVVAIQDTLDRVGLILVLVSACACGGFKSILSVLVLVVSKYTCATVALAWLEFCHNFAINGRGVPRQNFIHQGSVDSLPHVRCNKEPEESESES